MVDIVVIVGVFTVLFAVGMVITSVAVE
jgi:hypothetical protein